MFSLLYQLRIINCNSFVLLLLIQRESVLSITVLILYVMAVKVVEFLVSDILSELFIHCKLTSNLTSPFIECLDVSHDLHSS